MAVTKTSTAPVDARASEQPRAPRPEFIRLPKSGSLCPWTGLSRSKLNELVLPSPLNRFRPPVRSVSLRNRGQVKAVRLVAFDSLMGYLRRLETEQTAEAADTFPAEQTLSPSDATHGPVAGLSREACAFRTATGPKSISSCRLA